MCGWTDGFWFWRPALLLQQLLNRGSKSEGQWEIILSAPRFGVGPACPIGLPHAMQALELTRTPTDDIASTTQVTGDTVCRAEIAFGDVHGDISAVRTHCKVLIQIAPTTNQCGAEARDYSNTPTPGEIPNCNVPIDGGFNLLVMSRVGVGDLWL